MIDLKKATGILLGALLICCGVVAALNVFGVANINFSLDGWWTLFIIIPSVSGLLTSKDKAGSLIGLGFGVMLLLAARDVIDYDMVWKILVPVIIVALGVKIIVKTVSSKEAEGTTASGEQREVNAIFGEQNVSCDGEEVAAAKVAAVFGGATCNLKNVKNLDGCHIDLLCVFGGADILVPENVTVKNNTFCLFGGISDKRTVKSGTENEATLYINGFCIFGGADIK